jgi:hypothetical protein
MSSTPNELIKDALFQLNAILWMTQPHPALNSVKPIFSEVGFVVYAIAPALSPPPDIRLRIRDSSIAAQDNVRPDVVLANENQQRFAFLECKARSFGPKSSTSAQARTLLIVAGPRSAEVLALGPNSVRDSCATYVVPEGERGQLSRTISQLVGGLSANGITPGNSIILGLNVTGSHIVLVTDQQASMFFGIQEGNIPVIVLEPETDPRPLYFIPYDPDVFPSQSREEATFCKNILFERMQSSILAAVGHAHSQQEIVLEPARLLNDAMFGMYDHWQNKESARHMRHLCRQFIAAIRINVNRVVGSEVVIEQGDGWVIRIDDEEQREKILNAFADSSCIDLGIEPRPERDLDEFHQP